jgi:GTP cyclohydrolase II
MDMVRNGVISNLFGTRGPIGVSRGVAEFQAGRPVLIIGHGQTSLALPVEGLDARRLAEFNALCAPALPRLVITTRRARALGVDAAAPVALRLGKTFDTAAVLSLAADIDSDRALDPTKANALEAAAVQLVKLSQGLPAVLVAEVAAAPALSLGYQLVAVDYQEVASFRDHLVKSLAIASKAKVPLAGARSEFVIFRDAAGGSSAAIIVGKPNYSKPVLVRLHSACLTGDVFGSRRCDCGDQLKLSIKRLQEMGGGIILYLNQEGRGLGLANKMRTYQMQDEGLDTVDANLTLGFDDDERDYGIAARMLQMLDCRRVVLLTNNPAKLDGLAKSGIEITGRLSLEAPVNSDNRRYLTAKAARAGHQLHQILSAEPSLP